MWQDYENRYSAALRDKSFLSWRETGARQKARNIVQVCRAIKVTSMMEIGCGTGVVLKMLHAMKFAEEYTCIDVSDSAIEFVKQSCRDFNPRVFVGDATGLPFEDAAFSVAILTHVIEHLEAPVSALREASRVARYVVIEVPTEQVLSNMVRRKLLGRPYPSIAGAGHVQFWSPKSIVAFLEKICDFQILAQRLDLIDRDIEFFGKNGFRLAKPILKESLKTLLPDGIYSHLLTTHSTFLCSRRDQQP